jgi:hypothetical protein
MSEKGPAESPADLLVEAAVKIWKVAPILTVKQVMLAAEFTADNANMRTASRCGSSVDAQVQLEQIQLKQIQLEHIQLNQVQLG